VRRADFIWLHRNTLVSEAQVARSEVRELVELDRRSRKEPESMLSVRERREVLTHWFRRHSNRPWNKLKERCIFLAKVGIEVR
jgi:hypothetical protein